MVELPSIYKSSLETSHWALKAIGQSISEDQRSGFDLHQTMPTLSRCLKRDHNRRSQWLPGAFDNDAVDRWKFKGQTPFF
jgi:hypothetical protein